MRNHALLRRCLADVTLVIDDRALYIQTVKAHAMFMPRLSTFAHNRLFTVWNTNTKSQPKFGGVSPVMFFACAMTNHRAAPCVVFGP